MDETTRAPVDVFEKARSHDRSEQLEQAKQRRGRVADGNEAAGEPVAPEFECRRRARGAELLRKPRDTLVAQRADHVVVRGQPCARDAVR